MVTHVINLGFKSFLLLIFDLELLMCWEYMWEVEPNSGLDLLSFFLIVSDFKLNRVNYNFPFDRFVALIWCDCFLFCFLFSELFSFVG